MIFEARSMLGEIASEPVVVEELTTPDIWNTMRIQIYRVRQRDTLAYLKFYIIDRRRIISIGGYFNPDLNMIVCDLDRNGKSELVYTYKKESGEFIGCYTEGRSITIDTTLTPDGASAYYSYQFRRNNSADIDVVMNDGGRVRKAGKLSLRSDEDGRKELYVR